MGQILTKICDVKIMKKNCCKKTQKNYKKIDKFVKKIVEKGV